MTEWLYNIWNSSESVFSRWFPTENRTFSPSHDDNTRICNTTRTRCDTEQDCSVLNDFNIRPCRNLYILRYWKAVVKITNFESLIDNFIGPPRKRKKLYLYFFFGCSRLKLWFQFHSRKKSLLVSVSLVELDTNFNMVCHHLCCAATLQFVGWHNIHEQTNTSGHSYWLRSIS